MPRLATFYFARINKFGSTTTEEVLDAIRSPIAIEDGKFKWSIIDIEYNSVTNAHYIYGKLAKYWMETDVKTVNEAVKQTENKNEPNLIQTESTFIILPDHAGIAFSAGTSGITKEAFLDIFPRLINFVIQKNEVFKGIEIEPISDTRTFHSKILEFSSIQEIKAKVRPSNPQFSPLYEDLQKYLKERNSANISIEESSDPTNGLLSKLQESIKKVIGKLKLSPIPITDAAVIMAADGYGRAEVTGINNEQPLTITTYSTIVSLRAALSILPAQLFLIIDRRFRLIKKQRNIEHGSDKK